MGRLSKADEVECCTEEDALKETRNRDGRTDAYKHPTPISLPFDKERWRT